MAQFADVQTLTVGDVKITFLKDGGGLIDPAAMYPASAEKGWDAYADYLNEKGQIVVSIGGFLIEMGEHKIIMDLGFGPQTIDFPGFGPFTGGEFMQSFAQTGLSPAEITDVVYSHLHLDHVGWTSTDGKLTFPNAKHMATQADWDFWVDDESGLGMNPETVIPFLKENLTFVNGGDEIAPGLTVLSTPGHTPGHISLHLTVGEQEIYFIVDLLHSEVQFYEAEWHAVFDVDAELGRKSREGLYPQLARENVIVADGHFSDKVFGTVTLADGRPQWHPID